MTSFNAYRHAMLVRANADLDAALVAAGAPNDAPSLAVFRKASVAHAERVQADFEAVVFGAGRGSDPTAYWLEVPA